MGLWKLEIATEIDDSPVFIDYNICDCFEKYPFKKKSKLLPFLRKFKGWTEDEKGEYSVNYLIAVMMAILKERKLITFKPDQLDKLPCIKVNREIGGLFKYDISQSHLYLAEFYANMSNELETDHDIFEMPTDLFRPLLRCPSKHSQEFQQLIQKILE